MKPSGIVVRTYACVAAWILAATCQVATAQAQVFRAVAIHGDVERPFIVSDDAAARCLWFFTYEFYSTRSSSPPMEDARSITLSFVTNSQWSPDTARQPTNPIELVQRTTFQTRLILAPIGVQPLLQYNKLSSGFISRMELHPFAEAYLAQNGIPTRLDAEGIAHVRQYSRPELEEVATLLQENLGTALPACRIRIDTMDVDIGPGQWPHSIARLRRSW